jgi:hypothetical protein
MRYKLVFAVLSVLTGGLCAGCRDDITLLEFEEVRYYEDGASVASVVQTDYNSDMYTTIIRRGTPSRIIQNDDESIPLLIDHLDDMRLSWSTFNGRAVPVGYLCLDILGFMVENSSPVFVPDCCDDGLGAYYREGYYFRPNAHLQEEQPIAEPPEIMQLVKANWKKAYREGKVKCRSFEFGYEFE